MMSKRSLPLLLGLVIATMACTGSAIDEDIAGDEVDDRRVYRLQEHHVRMLLEEQDITGVPADFLIDQLRSDEDDGLDLQGVLLAQGWNFGLIIDNDDWAFDATFVDPASGDLVHVSELFNGRFYNGGLQASAEYKWVMAFITGEPSVDDLDGGVYGRGIGLSGTLPKFPLGAEIAWMPGDNRPGNLLLLSISAGVTGGLHFPKIEFSKNLAPE